MSYTHHISLGIPTASYFDETLNEHIYTLISFRVASRNINTGEIVTSNLIIYELPPPDPQTFVSSVNVNESVVLSWIDKAYDIVALQNENIVKFTT